jgi:hypothetical protein
LALLDQEKSGSLRNDVLHSAHLHIWYFIIFFKTFILFFFVFFFHLISILDLISLPLAMNKEMAIYYASLTAQTIYTRKSTERPLNTRSKSWEPPFLGFASSSVWTLLRHSGFMCRARSAFLSMIVSRTNWTKRLSSTNEK